MTRHSAGCFLQIEAAAPWHIVPADRKWYRNWAITQLLCEALEGVHLRWPEPAFDLEEERRRVLSIP